MSKHMRRICGAIAIVAGLSGVAAYAGRPFFKSGTPKASIQWRSSLDAARADAQRTGKPMLLVFDASWCLYCDKMEAATLNDPVVATQINHRFIPVRLDLQAESRAAQVLEVDRVPCTIALSPDADLLGRVVGYVKTDTYRESLDRIAGLHQRVQQASK